MSCFTTPYSQRSSARIFNHSPKEVTAVFIAYHGRSKWYDREALTALVREWWFMDGDPDDMSPPPTNIEGEISFLEDIESVFSVRGLRYGT